MMRTLLAARRRLAVVMALTCLVSFASGAAIALQPDEVLADKQLEQRARRISLGLRCLVCQNQSIDDSDAQVAQDLRRVVRQRLVAGDSDANVMAYIVDRYGDFVLLKPPFNMRTVLLWGSPVVVLLLGAGVVVLGRRSARKETDALSGAEQAELQKLLDDAKRDA